MFFFAIIVAISYKNTNTILSSENQTMLWTLLDILWITLTLMVGFMSWLVLFLFSPPRAHVSVCVCVVCTAHRLCSPGVDNTQWLQSGYFDGRTEVRAFRNIAHFMHTNIKTFHFIVMQRVREIVAVNKKTHTEKSEKWNMDIILYVWFQFPL